MSSAYAQDDVDESFFVGWCVLCCGEELMRSWERGWDWLHLRLR